MYQRIKDIMSKYNYSSYEVFAKAIGVLPNTLRQQMTNKRALSLDTVVAILNTFDAISADWLIRGEGDMNKSHTCSNSLNGVAVLSHVKQQNIVEDANRSLQNRIQQLEEENKYMRKQNEQLQEQNIKLVNKMMEKL